MKFKSVGVAVMALALITGLTFSAFAGEDGISRGNQAAMAGDFQTAVAEYTQAIDSGKLDKANLAVALNNRGSAYDDLSQSDKALADYNRAIEVSPGYHEAWFNRSHYYEKHGKLALALRDVQQAASLAPGDPDYKKRVEYLQERLGH